MQPQSIKHNEESDLKKLFDLITKNKFFFIASFTLALLLAFLVNRYSIPQYNVSSSILIKENTPQNSDNSVDYINTSLFGRNHNFQNELWVMKSSQVIDEVIDNLNLEISYYRKDWIRDLDAYKNVPFKIRYIAGHQQPIHVVFSVRFLDNNSFSIEASSSKKVSLYNFETGKITQEKKNFDYIVEGTFGQLIQTPDLNFVVEADTLSVPVDQNSVYGFALMPVPYVRDKIMRNLEYKVADKLSTVIEIRLKTESADKGKDIINGIMSVYSEQNLQRKNHIANTTIEYIERQLDEISDSLRLTEDNLQKFRSNNQLLNVSDQATGISAQYMDLQNQLAELVSKKRYYDYVADYLAKDEDFSNIMLPSALGIQDQILNTLMQELITFQAQRSNLIENKQERNPMVQKLGIQIDNIKKTISENINAVVRSTSLSIDEMSKRIKKIESEISRLPATQRQLGNIERRYKLNDAIYNYLMQKRAEAKITQASNLPDDLIIEPARMLGLKPVAPNKSMNYLIAMFLGLAFPIAWLTVRNTINDKIEGQEDIERITNASILGKILHNPHRSSSIMLDHPNVNIAESFRSLRTNLNFYLRGGQKKTIMVTSCLQGEGKTFISYNLAMSYAQLGKTTILVNFDFRKQESILKEYSYTGEGLSSCLADNVSLDEIIVKTLHDKLNYIHCGVLPPNPSELIALDKTGKILATLKDRYDVIILDTAPLGQVTDAYLLVDYADMILVVSRQNYTSKKVFSSVMKDLTSKGLKNIGIVFNDNRNTGEQYGYGYGYENNGKKPVKIPESSKKRGGEILPADVAQEKL